MGARAAGPPPPAPRRPPLTTAAVAVDPLLPARTSCWLCRSAACGADATALPAGARYLGANPLAAATGTAYAPSVSSSARRARRRNVSVAAALLAAPSKGGPVDVVDCMDCVNCMAFRCWAGPVSTPETLTWGGEGKYGAESEQLLARGSQFLCNGVSNGSEHALRGQSEVIYLVC